MARKRAPTYRQRRATYTKLLRKAKVKPSWRRYVKRDVRRILKDQAFYKKMGNELGIPWQLIGVIYLLETGCRPTSRHPHCGTSLRRRTTLVPKNRPRTHHGPFTPEESCRDAFTKNPHNLARVKDWTIERMLYELEKYNGWGYALYHSSTPSPYLWSGTTVYRSGKYVRDGKWSSSAVSKQLGCAPVLLELLKGKRYARKEIIKSSRKLRVADTTQKSVATAGAAVATLGALPVDKLGAWSEKIDLVKGMVADNAGILIVGVLLVGYLVLKYVKDKSIEDHDNGRYTPSSLGANPLDDYSDDLVLGDEDDNFSDLDEGERMQRTEGYVG